MNPFGGPFYSKQQVDSMVATSVPIGATITGGTDPSVLFIDAGALAQDPLNFGYNPSVDFFVKMGDLDLVNDTIGFAGAEPFSGAKFQDATQTAYSGIINTAGLIFPALYMTDSSTGALSYLLVNPSNITTFVSDGVAQSSINQNATEMSMSTAQNSAFVLEVDDAGYTPTGPLPFAGASHQGALPTISYNGLRLSGGVGQAIMEVTASLAGSKGRLFATQNEVTIEADVDANNTTDINLATGGNPTIQFSANSNANATTATFDPTTQIITHTATNATNTSLVTVDGGATPEARLNSTDGTGEADLVLDGDGYTVLIDANDGAGNNSSIIQLNGGTSVATITGSNGTASAQVAVDGDATPNVTTTVDDATNSSILTQLPERFTVNKRFEHAKGADVVAANDLTLGLGGNTFVITGNTQINAITTANWQEGSHITLKFTGTPTVKHNTAGGAGTAVILLAGSVDLVAADNTMLGLVFVESEWQETFRKVA